MYTVQVYKLLWKIAQYKILCCGYILVFGFLFATTIEILVLLCLCKYCISDLIAYFLYTISLVDLRVLK